MVTAGDDTFLEDLNSTNGTQVNGQPVKKHFFRDGDVVGLAQYLLRYNTESCQETCGNDPVPRGYSYLIGTPRLKLLNGSDAGKEIALLKSLTTVGHPRGQVAMIARSMQSYYLSHVEGNHRPLVNGKSIGGAPLEMANGDVIDLLGVRMQFVLSP
jgi:hypothetical protein